MFKSPLLEWSLLSCMGIVYSSEYLYLEINWAGMLCEGLCIFLSTSCSELCLCLPVDHVCVCLEASDELCMCALQ